MRGTQTIEEVLTQADEAVKHAQAVRQYHAKRSKRGSRQRETDIKLALERLRGAMRPVRHFIARLPYETGEIDAAGLRSASKALQTERRKLWKMTRKARKRRN